MHLPHHALCAATLALTTALTFSAPAVAAASAQGQRQAATPAGQAALRITGFDVRQVDRLEPGAELDFTLWGSAGASASLQIDGSSRVLALSETSPGRYEGSYTVGRRDRIGAPSTVTANLRRGNRVATALLGESLQAGAPMPAPVQAASAPKIESVRVSDAPSRGSRSAVRFTLTGTAGGHASVQLEGTQPLTVVLDEGRPGEYSAVYNLPTGTMVDLDKPLTARLRLGNTTTTSTVAQAFANSSWHQRRADWCADCGVVTEVRRIEVDGEGRVLGTVAGGVLGAVVGSQIGKGDGRTAAGVVGAVGGALLGREIERRSGRHTQFEVLVRLSDGQTKTLRYDNEPPFHKGDAVRVVGDTLEARRG